MSARAHRIAFIFIGGMHQALHIAPVAAAFARDGKAAVTAFVGAESDRAPLLQLLGDLGAAEVPVIAMVLPGTSQRPLKLLRLLAWAPRLRRFDAIVTAERTTTILKRLPLSMPPLIHIPHGAGDRAKGFEPRLSLFDHVIVAGEKDRRRMIAEGVVRPEACDVSGYVKRDAVERLSGGVRPRLFDDDRPVVLYNPHFDRRLSSWGAMGEAVVDRIAGDGRFNLIVAPHVRLKSGITAEERLRWERKAVPGRVIVDFGSPRSMDMSYTRAADIYVGDVSSQVYEFVASPRPCLFLNAHHVDWKGEADYAMWSFGAVAEDVDTAMAEVECAAERHPHYLAVQQAAVADAMGDARGRAPEIAAEQVLAAVRRLRANG